MCRSAALGLFIRHWQTDAPARNRVQCLRENELLHMAPGVRFALQAHKKGKPRAGQARGEYERVGGTFPHPSVTSITHFGKLVK